MYKSITNVRGRFFLCLVVHEWRKNGNRIDTVGLNEVIVADHYSPGNLIKIH